MHLRLLVALILTPALTHHAQAAWHEASSDHFVIYADGKEEHVRMFAERLERYHDAMNWVSGLPEVIPSPSNRVTIFVVRHESRVTKLSSSGSRSVVGFYRARAGGSIAVVPSISIGRQRLSQSESILLHEYAHHYMYNASARPYPRWFKEGFAEFYASARFEEDGRVGIGLPAYHRAREISYARDVPIHSLIDAAEYEKFRKNKYDSFYGRSWLLFHYLQFSESRRGQMVEYLTQLGAGEDDLDAATNAFGDLLMLDEELDAYAKRSTMTAVFVPADKMSPGSIAVRRLNKGESAVMLAVIQSKNGVTEDEASKVLKRARKEAKRHPDNAAVLSALAEAEYDAGNNKEAIAAADRAIALNPQHINAHLQRGYALTEIALDAEDAKQAWQAARQAFIEVNRIENDHPIPLIQYFRSYKAQGIEPTALAVRGLERALEIAPYDSRLRIMVAEQQMMERRYTTAVTTLEPLAYSPHSSRRVRHAQKLLAEAEEKAAKQSPVTAETNEPSTPETSTPLPSVTE